MGHQVGVGGEEFAAGGAGEGLLPDVDPLVLVAGEAFLALGEAVHHFGVLQKLPAGGRSRIVPSLVRARVHGRHVLLPAPLTDGGVVPGRERGGKSLLITRFVLLLDVGDDVIYLGVGRRRGTAGEAFLFIQHNLLLYATKW